MQIENFLEFLKIFFFNRKQYIKRTKQNKLMRSHFFWMDWKRCVFEIKTIYILRLVIPAKKSVDASKIDRVFHHRSLFQSFILFNEKICTFKNCQ